MREKQPIDRFWELLDPSLDAYSEMIERLLGYLTPEQLAGIVKSLEAWRAEDENRS